jgi:hypothetical protein
LDPGFIASGLLVPLASLAERGFPPLPFAGASTALAGSGFALVFAAVLLGALAVSAVRFLFLSLFLPRAKRVT